MSLLKGGNELFADVDQKILSSAKQVLLQNIEFQEAKHPDTEAQKIFSKYKPINASYNLKHLSSTSHLQHQNRKLQSQKSVEKDDNLPVPKVVLFPPEKIEMAWKELRRIGPGFSNLGNTCFLNSVLQVLTYTAPLVNFANSDAHRNNCVAVGFCLLCELRNHLTRVAKHSPQNGPIRPMTIIQKLSYISKNFKFGRQEDAHEFLRYFIEALRKSCLAGKTNLDRLSKETTAINQIFGGFFRSQVICLSCKKESNTYEPLMEINLDIKEANSIMASLKRTVRTEKLDGENRYFCERCRKKTPALKRGNIYKAPKILTLQLKRFDFQRLYGGKVPKHVSFTETLDLGPFMSSSPESSTRYTLYAVLVHSGISCNSGHYYCYVKAANGAWYEMNDSRVSQVGLGTVLRAQAYLLFYSIVQKPSPKVALQERFNEQKSNQTTPPSVSKQTPKKPFVKDIGISLFRQEPKIVPLGKDREKINFSFQGIDKNKPKTVVNKQLPMTPTKKKPSPEVTKTHGKSPSLEALMKDYDSGSSEDDKPLVEKATKTEATMKEKLESKEVAQEEQSQKESTDTQTKDTESKNTESKGSTFSTPKTTDLELLHQKRRIKNNVSSPQSASKFGRWFPVKNLNHTFTPRALYCRSFSDSAAFAKGKKLTTQISESSSPSVEEDEEKNGLKSKRWVVEEKKIPEVLFGPMTPPPTELTQGRERTTSVTSETSHVANKTGDWDVQDKDIPGTPLLPHIPERQFAGWSVEQNKPSTFRMNSTGHDSWDYNSEKETPLCRKLKDSSVKKSKKIKDGKRYERMLSERNDRSKSAHKKSKKRRKDSERKKDDDDDEEYSAKKRKKCEANEESYKEKPKKKKDKKKKKKKSKSRFDSDDEISSSGEERAKRKKSSSRKNSLEPRTPKYDVDVHKGRKKLKKSKKDKRRSDYLNSDDFRNSAKDSSEKSKENINETNQSQSTPKTTPRRVPLTFLGSLTKSCTGKSGGNQSEDPFGSCIKTPDEEKRHKKKKKSKFSETDADEEKRPILEHEFSSNETIKKDVPVKLWDEAPKKVTSWNGSNKTSVVDALLSKKSRVETWNGESSNNIDDNAKSDLKRTRDQWDDEYDEGKKKKVKKHHHNHHRSSAKSKHNPFQVIQNQKNQYKADEK